MSANKSRSPVSRREYEIPNTTTDLSIADFLGNQNGKHIVAVQGMGFVGVAMSLVVANSMDCEQYSVIGVDQATPEGFWKISDINSGSCPIVSSDPLVNVFFQRTQEANNFYATWDVSAFQHASVIIVDINLDVAKNKSEAGRLENFYVPMKGFGQAIRDIGANCRPDVLVLVETTVPPGTCEKVVKPILVDQLAQRGLSAANLKIGHSYERVMPGPNYINSIKNFYRVFSGVDSVSADAAEMFLKSVISTEEYPLTRLAIPSLPKWQRY